MGKIFGISNNPVSTITSVFEPLKLEAPKVPVTKLYFANAEDKFVPAKPYHKSNPIVKMRNGIGKLMSHFSHAKPKAYNSNWQTL